jgi:hypothetical protein
MPTGSQLIALAETRIGEKYENVKVPKDNPNWHGPWDCAEFASWVVFQKVGKLFGCDNNKANPAVADAYSGAWARDVKNGLLTKATEAEALNTPGLVLVREPPLPGQMGHIALSDGFGKTVEAAGKNLGVKKSNVTGRLWHHVVKIPGVTYKATAHVTKPKPLPFLLELKTPNVKGPLVRKVQSALKAAGFDPGTIDGAYGPHSVIAVTAFQTQNKLVADGIVGPGTAKKLGIDWPTI